MNTPQNWKNEFLVFNLVMTLLLREFVGGATCKPNVGSLFFHASKPCLAHLQAILSLADLCIWWKIFTETEKVENPSPMFSFELESHDMFWAGLSYAPERTFHLKSDQVYCIICAFGTTCCNQSCWKKYWMAHETYQQVLWKDFMHVHVNSARLIQLKQWMGQIYQNQIATQQKASQPECITSSGSLLWKKYSKKKTQ